MILKVINHQLQFDMKNICTVFFPYEKIRDDGDEDIVVITERCENLLSVDAKIYDKQMKKTHILTEGEDMAVAMSVLLYSVLSELMGYEPPWGILFGVRPATVSYTHLTLPTT